MGKDEATDSDEGKGVGCVAEQELEYLEEVGGDKVTDAFNVVFLMLHQTAQRLPEEHNHDGQHQEQENVPGLYQVDLQEHGAHQHEQDSTEEDQTK